MQQVDRNPQCLQSQPSQQQHPPIEVKQSRTMELVRVARNQRTSLILERKTLLHSSIHNHNKSSNCNPDLIRKRSMSFPESETNPGDEIQLQPHMQPPSPPSQPSQPSQPQPRNKRRNSQSLQVVQRELPEELLFMILAFCDHTSLICMAQLNRQLYTLSNSSSLWQSLFLRKWTISHGDIKSVLNDNWKTLCLQVRSCGLWIVDCGL